MEIACEKCRVENNVNNVECSNNGSAGSHLTFYTYSAKFTCWRCNHENDVTIQRVESDETAEVMDSNTTYN